MISKAHSSQIKDIVVAADLLRRMFAELQRLSVDNSRLHFAMLNVRYAIQQRLYMLAGLADSLKAARSPGLIPDLSLRAKMLISQLAVELEQLALEVEDDFEWIELVPD